MFAICHQLSRSSASAQCTRCPIRDRTGLLSLSDKRSFHPTFPQKGCESKAFLISLLHATPPRGINLIETQYIQNYLCTNNCNTHLIVDICCPRFRKHISSQNYSCNIHSSVDPNLPPMVQKVSSTNQVSANVTTTTMYTIPTQFATFVLFHKDGQAFR